VSVTAAPEAELFTRLRRSAYSRRWHVTDHDQWCREITALAQKLNATMPDAVDNTLVDRMATSIAAWTWKHITPEGFSAAQARRGRLGGLATKS
jgi:hypothetical protein